jgi:hypothetical protein
MLGVLLRNPLPAAALLALAAVSCRSAPEARGAPRPGAVVPPALEVVSVPASGEPARFATALAAGDLYLLEAAGAVALGAGWLDAECMAGADDPFPADVVGTVDVGLDVGIAEVLPARGRVPAPPSGRRLKWFEGCPPDHRYHLLVTGTGEPLAPRLLLPQGAAGATGAGAVKVSLRRLTPGPPPVGDGLEKVMVPAREKVSVRSRLVGQHGVVYLLQAAGEVQVGGPRHMGDAEFHDYKADGRGYNEGEQGVDFGVGVDDPVIGLGHDPRARKWGPYRRDHTYYMLYAGTGQPITLNYHDTGGKSGVFKDNEGSLPVTIFLAP